MDTNIIQHNFVICTVKYTHLCIRHMVQTSTYINKVGNPSTKSIRHVNANVNTQRKTKTIKIVIMKWKTLC